MGNVNVPLLECRQVEKHYGALAAVDNVDLSIFAGETIGIGGPNGAGKTTFFDLISGLTPVSRGQVLYNGQDITGFPPYQLVHQGMARTFQVTSGFTSLSVYQNMMAAVIFGSTEQRRGLFFNKDLHRKTVSSLEEYGLSEISHAIVADIPVLARKKLMVATAIVHSPKILLLDEPVGGLMPSEVDEFISLMDQVRALGIAIVFIEHVMRFLTTAADRALIMHQGKLIYDGDPHGIAEDETVKSVYLGSSEKKLGEM